MITTLLQLHRRTYTLADTQITRVITPFAKRLITFTCTYTCTYTYAYTCVCTYSCAHTHILYLSCNYNTDVFALKKTWLTTTYILIHLLTLQFPRIDHTNPIATVRQLLIPRKLKVKCNSLCKSHHSCKEDEYIIANTAKNIQFSCTCNTICIEIVNITKYHDTSRSTNSDHTTLLQLIIHLLTCGIQHSNSDHTTLLHLQHHWLYTHLHHDIPHSYSITYSSAIAKEIIISHYTLSQLQRDCWHVVHTSSIELRYLTTLLQLQGGC